MYMKPRFKKDKEFAERVIKINRITRVVKGGRRLRFRATVVIGNHKGKIGLGIAKANEVSDAVVKAVSVAKNNLIDIPIYKDTIPHQIIGKYESSKILFKPATAGTGVIAGGAVRVILEISGIHNVVAKTFGSRNKVNTSRATIDALSQVRTKEEIYQARGKELPKPKPKPAKPKTPPKTKKS
ncbi:30S ribosomal protein S5 [Patescibacteria group bacterium]|nr:30S ribosomal protein S5 [Patescibacteria group bacterium]